MVLVLSDLQFSRLSGGGGLCPPGGWSQTGPEVPSGAPHLPGVRPGGIGHSPPAASGPGQPAPSLPRRRPGVHGGGVCDRAVL